ncbi:MAG TPA: ATP-binding protein, partial [Chitinophagaceae bacterium]|nr:ATP-binding protein [Chitinophagaceae bacterium]
QPGGKIKSWKGAIAQQGTAIGTDSGIKNSGDLKEANQLIVGNTGAYIYSGKTIYEFYLDKDRIKSRPLLEDIDVKDLFTIVYHTAQQKYYLGSLTSGLYVITPSSFCYPPVPRQAMAEFRTQVAVEGGKGIICEQYLYNKGGYMKLPISRQLGASAYAGADDNVYYGMTAELLKFNLKTGTNQKLFELDSRPMGIIQDRADSNSLLLATYFSTGKLWKDTVKDFRKVPGLKKGKEIWGCSQIGIDTLLLWTQEGLKWYDFKANRIFRSILDSMTIHCAYADTGQRIWISTYGKGFFLYHHDRITRLPSGPLDALNAIHSFIDDGRGYFWFPTNNGLYRTRKADLLAYAEGRIPAVYYYTFFTRNGLRTNEFNGNSLPGFVWLRDSMLSLLTIQGPVWFYPHRLPVVLPDQGIYIEQVRLGDTLVPWGKGILVLPPDHGTLSVTVSSPYFGNRENMQLQFRIEGLDEAWHEVPANGEIMLSRIPTGAYVLVLRKMTGREPGEYTRLSLSIRVRPHWYNTWLFYLALFSLLALLVYWLIRLRTNVLRVRNRRLKTQVALQTRDLNRAVRQLTRSEDALKESNLAKDNIITTVLHDLRSPVRFLYTISKHVAGRHRTMPPETLDNHLEELKNSTAALNSFTDQFFAWAISQHRNFTAKYTTESLSGIFEDAASLYTDIMGANGNRLVIEPTDLYCYTDPQLLSAVIRNLLDNANKNTRNGTIRLSAADVDLQLVITVSDTGKGFTPEALKAFLNPGQTGAGSGKGSFIVLYLLGLIRGRLDATSAPGEGTEFRITLSRLHSGPGSTPGG